MKQVFYILAFLLFVSTLEAQETQDTIPRNMLTHQAVLDSLKLFSNSRVTAGLNVGTTINSNSQAFGDGNVTFGMFFGDITQHRLEFENLFQVSQTHVGINFRDCIGESGNKFDMISFELSNVEGKSWELSTNHMLGFYVGGAVTWTDIDLKSDFTGSFQEGEAVISVKDDDYLTSYNFGQTYKWGVTYSTNETFNVNVGWESNHVLHHFLPYKYLLSSMLYGLGDQIISVGSEAIIGINNYSPIINFAIRGAYFLLLDNIKGKEMYAPYSGSPTFHFNQFKVALSYSI